MRLFRIGSLGVGMDFSYHFNAWPDPVLLVDVQTGAVLGHNDAACRLLDFSSKTRTVGSVDASPPAFVVDPDRWSDFCHGLLLGRVHRQSAQLPLRGSQGNVFEGWLEGIVLGNKDRPEVLVVVRPDTDLASRDVPVGIASPTSEDEDDPHYGILRVRSDGRLVFASRRALRMLGYERWQDLQERNSSLVSLYGHEGDGLGMSGLAASFGRGVERDLVRRDGGRLRVFETARRLARFRSEELWELRWLDIETYRATAEELALCQEKYRVLVEHSQDGVFITHQGLYVYVNNTYAQMLGRRPEDMIDRPFMEFIAPEDRQRMAAMWRDREAGRWERTSYEIRLLHQVAERRVVASVRSGPIYYKGKLSSTGTIRDITEERRAQAALEEVRRNYQEIFENLQIGIFQTTLDGRLLSANRAYAHFLGYDTVDQLLGELRNVDTLYQCIEDRKHIVEELHTKGHIAEVEVELRRRDGRSVWGALYSRLVILSEGNQPYIEGGLVDVTERRRVEQALARSEEFYRSLVEHGHVGVFMSAQGRLTYVNEAFAGALGFGRNELQDRPLIDFVVPAQRDDADREFRASRVAPQSFECDFVHREKRVPVAMLVSVETLTLEGRAIMVATAQDISKQREALDQLRYRSRHDPLTGLPNRTVFHERLSKAARQSQNGPAAYAVVFLVLDAFKLVNDTLGHLAGDELLVQAARRFEERLPPGSLISRHGGEEFAIFLSGITAPADVDLVLTGIDESLEAPFSLRGQDIYTNASYGIAMGGPDYTNPEDVLRDADTALHEAKSGDLKGRRVFFDRAMRLRAAARLQAETSLRNALSQQEFEVVYQPIVSLNRGEIVGLESLLRWRRSDGTRESPDAFWDVAEDIGLTVPLNRWFLEEVAQHLARWIANRLVEKTFYVSFNLSQRQLYDPGLVPAVRDILARHAINPSRMRVEVTETVILDRYGEALKILETLRNAGLSVALDDFGTGYSSLGYLRDLLVDALKIDRSFLAGVEASERNKKIISSLIDLSRALGMDVVAEGVETEDQLNLLRRFRCPCAQGFYFSAPVGFEETTQALNAHWRFKPSHKT